MNTNYFSNRRSIRRFKPEPLTPNQIKNLLELASKAPTTGNMQLYSAIVTMDEDNKRALATCHFNQPAAVSAPVMITICADFNRFEHWCKINDAECGFSNLQGMLYAFLDAAIYAQQVVTIAEMQGLGTCYLGTTPFNAPEIAKLLKLPPRVVPITTIAIGYPDGEGDETERILPEGYIHFEAYTPFSDADIARIYAPKDEFEDNKKFVAENNKKNLAQVFTDIRYPKSMNEEFSKKLSEWLAAMNLSL